MTYSFVKAIHVTAVIIWMSGMLVAPLLIRVLASLEVDRRGPLAKRLRATFKALNTPAMLVTWGLGGYLMFSGGYYVFLWAKLKIAMVFGLSGLHGFYSACLRRLMISAPVEPAALDVLLALNIAAVLGISLLVICKPM